MLISQIFIAFNIYLHNYYILFKNDSNFQFKQVTIFFFLIAYTLSNIITDGLLLIYITVYAEYMYNVHIKNIALISSKTFNVIVIFNYSCIINCKYHLILM